MRPKWRLRWRRGRRDSGLRGDVCRRRGVGSGLRLRHLSNFQMLLFWVAVKELKLSYYIGEALLFTIYTHYGNLI